MKHIMNKKAYESGQIKQAVQDGNRKFVTLIACVSVTGEAIPPTLLYKSASGDLQDTWMEDVEEGQQAFFGGTENGWSSNAYGLKWLTEVFDPSTRRSSIRTWRLLIVDGHSSHINLEFLIAANRLHICVLILPPHSTHQLQPLDLVLFLPLSTAYQVNLDAWMNKSMGLTSFSKRFFWKIFWPAWKSTLGSNKKLIQHSFAKPGIWPINPTNTLSLITNKRTVTPPPPEVLEGLEPLPLPVKTPLTSKSIRHIQRQYHLDPSPSKLDLLFRSQQKLAAQHEIDQHIQGGLLETLKDEKKRRQ